MPLSPATVADIQALMGRAGLTEGTLREQFVLGSGNGGQKIKKTASAVGGARPPEGVLGGGGRPRPRRGDRGGGGGGQHRLADLHGVGQLGAHEGLGGVLKAQVHTLVDEGLGHLINEVGGVGGDFGDAVGVHVEDHLPLEGGGGVVEVENDVLGALGGLEGLVDQRLPGLNQHLDGHVVGDVAPLDELPADLILRLAGGGEADLDLLDADVHQSVEVLQLLLEIHGVHQGLVAVPQVHGAPGGGLGDHLVGPGAAHNLLGLDGDILFVAWIHGSFLLNESIFTVEGCFWV